MGGRVRLPASGGRTCGSAATGGTPDQVAERLHTHISTFGAGEIIATTTMLQLTDRLASHERLAEIADLTSRQASQSVV